MKPDFDSLEYFEEYCQLATLAELKKQEKAAVFLLSELGSEELKTRARKELSIIRKNIREIEQ